MTEDTQTSESDAQDSTTNRMSRRDLLRAGAAAPLLTKVPDVSSARSGSDTVEPDDVLVTAADLPPAFEPYASKQLNLARRLAAVDPWFEHDQFYGRGFTEGPDQSDPRYVVATVGVRMPGPDSIDPFRIQVEREFEALLECYSSLPGTDVVRNCQASDEQPFRFDGTLEVDPLWTTDIGWVEEGSGLQCRELWSAAATDSLGALVVVFGDRNGPWRPRDLFRVAERASIRHLHPTDD